MGRRPLGGVVEWTMHIDGPALMRQHVKSATLGSMIIAWIGLCSVLRPRQHSIGYMGDGFYRSKDPTNSIKVLKENNTKNKENTKLTCIDTQKIDEYSIQI